MSKAKWIALFVCGAAGYVMTLLDWGHAHAWEYLPAFYCVFGFVGCALIVYVSKGLGKLFIQKPEDYYDDD
ncbi:MAG: hypothetical protein ACYTEG_11790 [Planctomycetota bacterium]|jgi:hypothetical protein